MSEPTNTYDEAVVTEVEGVRGVRAVVRELAFFEGHRVRRGEEVFLPLTTLKPAPAYEEDETLDDDMFMVIDGEVGKNAKFYVLPRFVIPHGPNAQRLLVEIEKTREQRFAAAAVASSGSGHG